jgi:hypothetical protein
MTAEERWQLLLAASKRVLLALRQGRNPTFSQLDKLDAAIESLEAEKICGHLLREECDCYETEQSRGRAIR